MNLASARIEGRIPSHRVALDRPSAPRSGSEPAGTLPITLSVIMPTVFWSGTFERCARRLLSQLAHAKTAVEVVFVFDGKAPPTPAWLDQPGVTVVTTGVRSGPAIARNLAARSARGNILFFVDADVELAPDALERVRTAFDADPDMVGLFGAYDDEPAAHGVASTFRNLLHHHTHATNPGPAQTFWSGCGAIRAAAFLDVGGFDAKYAVPSVEDIELGMRIVANGGRIVLDPQIRCKHLKHWSLTSMVITDVAHRARPWTQLIVNARCMPGTLNLNWRNRLSSLCSLLLVGFMGASPFVPAALWAALACGLAVAALNHDFYRLCLKKRGIRFAAASFALHLFFFIYSAGTFCVVLLQEVLWNPRQAMACADSLPSTPARDRTTTVPTLIGSATR